MRFLSTWLLILGGFFIVVVRFLPNGLASLLEAALGLLAYQREDDANGRDERRPTGSSGVRPMAGCLKFKHLCKSFDTVRVINDFSLEVVEGTLCCLVGPNGAGKTTTMDLITGRHQADVRARSSSRVRTSPACREHEIARAGHRPQVPGAGGVRGPDRCGRT